MFALFSYLFWGKFVTWQWVTNTLSKSPLWCYLLVTTACKSSCFEDLRLGSERPAMVLSLYNLWNI